MHVDSKVIVKNLPCDGDVGVAGFRLVQKIRQLLELDWEVKVCHTYREANFCVDALAAMACRNGSKMIIYEQPPAHISSLLFADFVGILHSRSVAL